MPDSLRPRDLAVGLPAALVAGVLIGVLGTFKRQVGVSALTGGGWPVGLVLSLAMLALVLAALRLTFPTRLFALAAGVGAVAAVAVLLLPSPGGSSVVVLDPGAVSWSRDWPGLVWAVAAPLVAAVVVAWPARRVRAGADPADGMMDGRYREGDRA